MSPRPPRPRLMGLLGLMTLPALAVPPAALGQLIVGRLTEEATAAPVEGAFLVLLDAEESRHGQTLTHPDGTFVLRAPGPGRYQILTQRIGYQGHRTAFFDLGAETLSMDISVATRAIDLEGLVVEGRRGRCALGVDEGEETAVVWEEARKALEVARWGEESGLLRYRVTRTTRRLDRDGRRVESEASHTEAGWGRNPFQSAPVEELQTQGYVRGDTRGDQTFFAPDAEVLLSDSFLDSHCFQVTRSPGRVGLAFEPVPGRSLPDVEGVLWLDEGTAELQRLEFEFTGVQVQGTNGLVGGEVEFGRVPGGAWIVSRWVLRMPVKGLVRSRPEDPARVVMIGLAEEGGYVQDVELQDQRVSFQRATATLTGIVFDSILDGGLGGAHVALAGTGVWARTDGAGLFILEGITPGTYGVTVSHARLDSLGFGPAPAEVTVALDQPNTVTVSVPTLEGFVAERCSRHDPAELRGPRAVLVGVVRDAESGRALPGAEVEIVGTTRELTPGGRGVTSRSGGYLSVADGAGAFVACRVPPGEPEVRVRHDGRVSPPMVLERIVDGEIRHIQLQARFGRRP